MQQATGKENASWYVFTLPHINRPMDKFSFSRRACSVRRQIPQILQQIRRRIRMTLGQKLNYGTKLKCSVSHTYDVNQNTISQIHNSRSFHSHPHNTLFQHPSLPVNYTTTDFTCTREIRFRRPPTRTPGKAAGTHARADGTGDGVG